MPRNSLMVIYKSRDSFASSGKLSQYLADQSPNRISLLRIIINVLFRSALSQYKFDYNLFQLLAYNFLELIVLYIVRFNCAHYVYERMPTLI
jgi:hypothetical protein